MPYQLRDLNIKVHAIFKFASEYFHSKKKLNNISETGFNKLVLMINEVIFSFMDQRDEKDQELYVMIHSALRPFGDKKDAYFDNLFKSLTKNFPEVNFLVPTYTFSYRKSGIFHKEISRSEVGSFSEAFRTKLSNYRTNDPIFSISCLKEPSADFISASQKGFYSSEGLMNYLYKNKCYVINLLTQDIVSSFIHLAESSSSVKYKSFDHKYFGYIYESGKYIKRSVLSSKDKILNQINRKKIRKNLEEDHLISKFEIDGYSCYTFSSQEIVDFLNVKCSESKNYIVTF